jgi:hypothetical protein
MKQVFKSVLTQKRFVYYGLWLRLNRVPGHQRASEMSFGPDNAVKEQEIEVPP